MSTEKKLIYIGICLTLLSGLFLTSCGASRHLKKAEDSYARGEYYDAAKLYRKAYASISPKKRPLRGQVAFKMGECYRLINYSARARGAYMNAVRYHYPDTVAYLRLAQCQLKYGEYKQAAKSYETYLSFAPTDTLAINGLKSCEYALSWKKNPTRYIVKKATNFFSRRSDYSPMYAGEDTDILYFTSTRNEATGTDLNTITGLKSADIFESKKDEKGVWGKPAPVESEVNSEFEDGVCSFSADGKTMYFTRCVIRQEAPAYAEIFSSTRTGASWAAPVKCEILNDSLSSVAHPAMSPSGDFLYFVSDMPGGYGGLDIWRINVVKDGFGYVDNLGPAVNTAGDEMFPTFGPDEHLYFSSNGHPGMGGLDIFEARHDTISKTWTIRNLQYPVNSMGDDFGMTFEPGVHKGYFSSNRGDARGWDHLYTFELPDVKRTLFGWVYEKDGEALPEAEVTIVGDDGTYKKVAVKKDGSFEEKVDPGIRYVMLATCRGYLNKKQELLTDTLVQDELYEVEFPLSSITRPVLIENIFYEFDRADLTAESTASLDELIKLLNDNPNVTIELAAHCDYKGNDRYNEGLSQRRAESVVQYLIAGGISADRLTAKGYGESKPKIVTKQIHERIPALKEGTELTEALILTLPEAQQELCNAINRRTEFQVLRTTYGLYD